MKYVALVRDADNNELFFAETVGACQEWCREHGIAGQNGEYIAVGEFNEETKYFDLIDYDAIR